jgi:hypothetical protein
MLSYQDLQEVIVRPANFNKAERVQVQLAFEKLYQALGFENPRVICVSSPLELQMAIKRGLHKPIPFFPDSEAFSALERQLRESPKLIPINGKLWDLVSNQIARPLCLAFGDENGLEAQMSSLNPVFQELNVTLSRAIKTRLEADGLSPEPLAHHPNWFDLKWLSYYKAKLDQIPLAQELGKILDMGLMQAYCFDKLVLWTPKPSYIATEDNKLHGENHPSIYWNENFKLYHWNGVPVPAKLIESPQEIRKEDIEPIRNAEVRRSFLEKLGAERFSSLFDLQLVDSDIDLRGNRQSLYRSREIDPVAKEHLQFAQVICPTTQRVYFLTVPPHLQNVWEAVSWTFGKSSDEYQPEREV